MVTVILTCRNRWMPSAVLLTTSKSHGWVKGRAVAVQAYGQTPGLEHGFKTRYPIDSLAAAGLSPQRSLGDNYQASLLRLDIGTGYQYWYGLPNFYTITRCNHSTYYAMVVWQLGEVVGRSVRGSFESVHQPVHAKNHCNHHLSMATLNINCPLRTWFCGTLRRCHCSAATSLCF